MNAQKERDALKERKAAIMCKDGLKGNVSDAKDHLTAFTIDSEQDVMQMQRELQQTKDKL